MPADTAALVDPDTYLTGVPHETFARLRDEAAVVWMDEQPGDEGPGFWGVVRHAEVKEVMRDPVVYSSHLGATQITDPPDAAALAFVRQMMLNQDPPEHSRLRKLLTRAFTPRAIARLEDRIDGWARDLVGNVAGRTECDFATEVAADLPLLTLAELFGVPSQDRWLMFDWSNRVIGYQDAEYALSARADADGSTELAKRAIALRPRPDEHGRLPDQRTREGMPDLYAYAHDLGEYKRRHPGEDIMSNLMRAGDTISVGEFENLFWLFSVAGNETLRNALPGGLSALMSLPPHRRRRHRARRRAQGRGVVQLGQPRRAGVRRAGPLRRRPHRERPPGLRARAALLHRRALGEGADAGAFHGAVRHPRRGRAGGRAGATAVELPERDQAPADPLEREAPPAVAGGAANPTEAQQPPQL